ncbi:tetratricopeptide repeat protein [Nitrococcus mobilis]|uniref:TPR repeat n=1 Tax=Nitrococcus mobilis Nb-231 TaxID=314278 RepID=A4BT78_9GAMM|nr:tetratricopeptide repeat protein [Nitrococcus mobilis]EAR21146.1 TPR repeat [Nitrococcus mobilis Nb-231]
MSHRATRTRSVWCWRATLALAAVLTVIQPEPGFSADNPVRTYHDHGVYDYYAPASYPPRLIKNVLGYHIKPAEEGLKAGNWTKAEGNIGFILNYFPNHPEGLKLALAYAAKSGHDRFALDRIKKALDINPKIAWTHLVYGVYLHRHNDLAAAEREYRKATELDTDLADAYYNLGLLLVDAGNIADAKKAAQKAYNLGYPLPGLRLKLQKAKKSE